MRVSWDPPSPPGNTVGYRVSYNLSTATDIDISDVSTTSTTLTGLENRNYYTISVVGLSEHLQSEVINATIYLGSYVLVRLIRHILIFITFLSIVAPPSDIKVTVSSTTSTTISLDITATVPGNNYSITVTWKKLHPCTATDSAMYAPSSLMEYLITGLDEGSTYNITVTVTNVAGSNSSSPVIATTVEEGKTLTAMLQYSDNCDVIPFQLPLLLLKI